MSGPALGPAAAEELCTRRLRPAAAGPGTAPGKMGRAAAPRPVLALARPCPGYAAARDWRQPPCDPPARRFGWPCRTRNCAHLHGRRASSRGRASESSESRCDCRGVRVRRTRSLSLCLHRHGVTPCLAASPPRGLIPLRPAASARRRGFVATRRLAGTRAADGSDPPAAAALGPGRRAAGLGAERRPAAGRRRLETATPPGGGSRPGRCYQYRGLVRIRASVLTALQDIIPETDARRRLGPRGPDSNRAGLDRLAPNRHGRAARRRAAASGLPL